MRITVHTLWTTNLVKMKKKKKREKFVFAGARFRQQCYGFKVKIKQQASRQGVKSGHETKLRTTVQQQQHNNRCGTLLMVGGGGRLRTGKKDKKNVKSGARRKINKNENITTLWGELRFLNFTVVRRALREWREKKEDKTEKKLTRSQKKSCIREIDDLV